MSGIVFAWFSVLRHSIVILGMLWFLARLVFVCTKKANHRYLAAMGALVVWGSFSLVAFALSWREFSTQPPSTWLLDVVDPTLPWRKMIVALWLVGSLAVLAWQLFHYVKLWQITRRALQGPKWLIELVQTCAAQLGLKRPPQVRECEEVGSPCLVGCFSPVLLWPRSHLHAATREHVRLLVLHELTHLRRYDPWWLHYQLALESVFFYHPALWALSSMARRERETACDAQVLQVDPQPARYAAALLELEENRAIARPNLLAIAARSQNHAMIDRLFRILPGLANSSSFAQRSSPPSNRLRAPVLAAASFGLALVVGIHLQQSQAHATSEDKAVASAHLDPKVAAHWSDFVAAGERHGVDPHLLAALCWVESAGDPQARSRAGAIGLMQVMPTTFERLAQERALTVPTLSEAYDIATNVDYAAYLLARDIAHYRATQAPGQAIKWALAAYNAGSRRVEAVLQGQAELPKETVAHNRAVLAHWHEIGQVSTPQ